MKLCHKTKWFLKHISTIWCLSLGLCKTRWILPVNIPFHKILESTVGPMFQMSRRMIYPLQRVIRSVPAIRWNVSVCVCVCVTASEGGERRETKHAIGGKPTLETKKNGRRMRMEGEKEKGGWGFFFLFFCGGGEGAFKRNHKSKTTKNILR